MRKTINVEHCLEHYIRFVTHTECSDKVEKKIDETEGYFLKIIHSPAYFQGAQLHNLLDTTK